MYLKFIKSHLIFKKNVKYYLTKIKICVKLMKMDKRGRAKKIDSSFLSYFQGGKTYHNGIINFLKGSE